MAEQIIHTTKPFNRWIIVGAAMMVQFALGALYSYSFVQKPVMTFINQTLAVSSAYKDSDLTMLSLLPFAFALLFFAVGMVPAGRWQDKAGPKKVCITGSLVLLAGMMLAGVVTLPPSSGNIWGFIATFGMIGGVGIGLAYVCPIACATKWFPDKVGLINGLAVAGFGAGSILFNFIFYYLTAPISGVYRNPSTSLFVNGAIIGGLALCGAFILRNPPAGYKPAGWEPPAPKAGAPVVVENWTTMEMIHSKAFPLLWIMYLCSAICGLMVIGNFLKYGQALDPSLKGDLIAVVAAIAGACNAMGRIVWGKVLDKIGGVKTMRIMFLVQCFGMILFGLAGLMFGAELAFWAIFGLLVYFCFGGNLSLFPATTRKFYGPKNMGLNYGVVFSAYGVAGITGALLAGPLLALMGNAYTGYFILFGFMSLVAFFVSFITKTPERKAV